MRREEVASLRERERAKQERRMAWRASQKREPSKYIPLRSNASLMRARDESDLAYQNRRALSIRAKYESGELS